MYTINTYETYETITEILHDIYLGELSVEDIVDFLVYLEEADNNAWLIFSEFLNIIESLNDLGINSSDFTNTTNIGFLSPTRLIYFDIGFGDYYDKTDRFNLEKLNVGSNNMNVFDVLDLDFVRSLGNGGNGEAFELTDGRVLKITRDNSEAYNSCILLEKNNPKDNLVNIHYIAELYNDEFPELDIEKYYVIIQDMVNIDKDLIKQNYKFIQDLYSEFVSNI